MTEQTNKPKIVIIGAGATGRGHIGQVACDAGFDITFIERDKQLVDILSDSSEYTVGLAGENIEKKVVIGFKMIQSDDINSCAEAISVTDILATSVIPTNLRSIVPIIAAGLELREKLGITKPLNVIACENMERSSSTLKSYIKEIRPDLDWQWIEDHVGFPDSMVARAVPVPEDPLFLLAESTQEWAVDANAIKEPMPRVAGMTLSRNQTASLERKLYIKNTGHMSIGVLGFLKGYKLMDEAARDPEIFEVVDDATQESAASVVRKHGLDPVETESYRSNFLEQMKSPFLPDDINRVIREIMRKLDREERLVGPAALALEQGIEPVALVWVISMALHVVNPADPQSIELQEMIHTQGIEKTVDVVCRVEGKLKDMIIDQYNEVSDDLYLA
ncbi:MAG: mannitol dehydrogenase family protein [Armatimonadota bacterium]